MYRLVRAICEGEWQRERGSVGPACLTRILHPSQANQGRTRIGGRKRKKKEAGLETMPYGTKQRLLVSPRAASMHCRVVCMFDDKTPRIHT